MDIVWVIGLIAWIVISLITIFNALTFPKLSCVATTDEPFVSVLVPARNEASVISGTVKSLLMQDYSNYEVILLDDQSFDGTALMAQTAADRDDRFSIINGKPLPAGWVGKNWACHQLSQAAEGEILLFTDADIHWEPGGIKSVVSALKKQRVGLLTVWPTQKTDTWPERLVVPMMTFAVTSYLPETLVRRSRFSALAAANGQCMAFTKDAYENIGGHRSVQTQIVEDVALARRIKRAGEKLVMADGQRLLSARMYHNWDEVRDGFAKNILAGHGGSPIFLGLSAFFHLSLFVLPWLWLGNILVAGGWSDQFLFPLAMIALGVFSRALSAASTNQRIRDALLLPVSVMLMTVIAGQSLWWRYRLGGVRWKGRVVTDHGNEG